MKQRPEPREIGSEFDGHRQILDGLGTFLACRVVVAQHDGVPRGRLCLVAGLLLGDRRRVGQCLGDGVDELVGRVVAPPAADRLGLGVGDDEGGVAADGELFLQRGAFFTFSVDGVEDDGLEGLFEGFVFFRLTGEYFAGASPIGVEVEQNRHTPFGGERFGFCKRRRTNRTFLADTATTGGQYGESDDENGQNGRSSQWISPLRN